MTGEVKDTEHVLKQELDNASLSRPPLFGSCRFILGVLSFIGIFHMMIMRFNLSMAMVCMVKDNSTAHFSTILNKTLEGEFDWNRSTQGELLSAFFYGYIVTQVLGGYLSVRFGGKTGLLLGIGVLSLGTLLTPVVARHDYHILFGVRIVEGLVSGLAFPSIYDMFSVWTSPEERASLMSIVFSGIQIANIANYPLSSFLCQTGVDGGWPMVFYVPGATGLLWCIVFSFCAHSNPLSHPRIKEEELVYLIKNTKSSQSQKPQVPWFKMALSMPVHCLWITHLCSAWGYYLLAVNMPLYVKDVLKLDITKNGFLTCLPYVGMMALSVTGILFDWLQTKNWMSKTNWRKIFNTIGFVLPSICMFSLAIVPSEEAFGQVALLSIGMAVHELAITGGFYFSHADVAGPFSGVLFGITNTMAQIPGFANALLVAYLTPNGSREEWLSVFFIAAGIYIIGCLVYVTVGTSDLQAWAKEDCYQAIEQSPKKPGCIVAEEKTEKAIV